jgi:RNA-directed DNA polymerase
MIRKSDAEKREVIHIVEHSALSVKKTLEELQVPRSTFYRWYKQYLEEGEKGLVDHRPNPHQVWNKIPEEVKQEVVELALEYPDRSPRQIAWLFTDQKSYFISESSAYRILKSFDLVESPAFRVMSAADEFQHPTHRVHELWQTDFTYFKIQHWGWYYLSTVLDDFSRYIIAWKLTPTMSATDVQDTLLMALASTGLDQVLVEHRPRLLCFRRTTIVPRAETDGAHSFRALPSNDPGKDQALPSLNEDYCEPAELLSPHTIGN